MCSWCPKPPLCRRPPDTRCSNHRTSQRFRHREALPWRGHSGRWECLPHWTTADRDEVHHMTGNSTALRNGIMVARRSPPKVLLFLRQNHFWHKTRWCARRVFPVQDTSSWSSESLPKQRNMQTENKNSKSKNTLPNGSGTSEFITHNWQ